MAIETEINWTDSTFNGWWGCQKAGPGCDNCYAESMDKRTGGSHWGPGAERRRTSVKNWNDPVRWNKKADEFFAKHGRRQRVFCSSMSDVFDNAVPAQWRFDLLRLIEQTPKLDWLLLTKRIGNVSDMLETATRALTQGREGWAQNYFPNVWIGATIVNQTEADRDIPKLLAVPAAKRFLSMEPLLGPVDLSGNLPAERALRWHRPMLPMLDWVIVGGESGGNARPMHPNWVFSLRDQCATEKVPFLFKQWGEWAPRSDCYHVQDDGKSFADIDPGNTRWKCIRMTEQGHDGHDLAHAGEGDHAYMSRVGKTIAGRLLDGVLHHNFPPAPAVASVSIQE